MYDYTVGGRLLCGENFEALSGRVYVESGRIVEIEERFNVKSNDCNAFGTVLPSFVNAHTHLGDSIIKDVVFDSLDNLVKPPDGLKHRALREANSITIIKAINHSLLDAIGTGTATLVDFREGGVKGLEELMAAKKNLKNIKVFALGRPKNDGIDYIVEDDIDNVLDLANGIGISGVKDLNASTISKISNKAKKRGKILATHAGERDEKDINAAIALNPSFLVHMTHASKHQIESGIPIVVCPRSNLVTGVGASFCRPPISSMVELTTVGLGTDNVMFNSLNMFAEMEFASKAYLHNDLEVLKMATINGAKILNIAHEIGSIEVGKQARLMVLNEHSDNLCGVRNFVSGIVRRARPDDIIFKS
ncbi:MAG TPA: amidohydrolase family protein [Candidatus Acidoferrales bacterium]|nr:amidohydrolase family protein [Candidatus Acidoferrales bacterium]